MTFNESNIYLCGFMGCGKTTVGKRLAVFLEREFVDLDAAITEKYGDIPKIFAKEGEEYFRKLESDVLERISKRAGLVVSCGGGTPTVPKNTEIMKSTGKTVFIDTPFSECAKRVLARHDGKRPLASGGEKGLREIYSRRAEIYAKSSDITLRSENTPNGTARRIVRMICPEAFDVSNEPDFDRTVCVPSTVMYEAPDRNSAASDELLFGTNVRILGGGEFPLCETEYGYLGYVKACDVARRALPYFRRRQATVYSPWCDLLASPEYKHSPVMTLPRGAQVTLAGDGDENGRFIRVLAGTTALWARRNAFSDRFAEIPCGSRAARFAVEYIGTPYRWGGKSPSGIDCSGLVFTACRLCGKTVYRDSLFDERYVYEISRNELQAGDIIYMKGHAAMYIGDGMAVHASASVGFVEKKRLCDFPDSSIICYARVKE